MVTHPYMGPVPAFFYAAGQLMDYGVHSWDIRQTSGQAHGLSGDAADLLVPFMFAIWQGTVRTDAVTEPFTIGIRVSGRNAGDYRVSVSDQGLTYEPGRDRQPARATSSSTPAASCSRRSAAATPVRSAATWRLAERYLNLFFRI